MVTVKDSNLKFVAEVLAAGHVTNKETLLRVSRMVKDLTAQILDGATELRPLVDYYATQIKAYEEAHRRKEETSAVDVLEFLMEQHGHKLKDLEDIAPMSVISNIRKGKRELNKGQIERLAKKYHVSPAVFF